MTDDPEDASRSGFNKLARVYRWMEYATFGPLLQQTRLQFVPEISAARRVLVLGDGDGRFCVRMLLAAPQAQAVAMDASAAMLHRLRLRAVRAGVADRLTTVHGDASVALPEGEFDLVCTHFFLDCLDDDAVGALALRVRRQCPGAMWVVSEFAVPHGAMRWPARGLVGLLYAAFGLLTGLRNQRLPDHAAALRGNGFRLEVVRGRAAGLLRAELWQSDASPLSPSVHPTRQEGQHG